MRRLAVVGLLGALCLVMVGCNYIVCTDGKCKGTDEPDYIVGSGGADFKLIALASCDEVFGQGGDDKLFGDDGGDALMGNRGDDKLFGGEGDDYLADGDSGNPPSALLAEISACVTGENDPGELEAAAESYREPDAVLPNGASVEPLRAEGGKDKLFGGSGDDELYAADGRADFVDCGKGVDRAVVDPTDEVSDCAPGEVVVVSGG